MRQGVVVLIIAIASSVGYAKETCETDLERALRMRPRSAIDYSRITFNQRIERLQNLIMLGAQSSADFTPLAIEIILLSNTIGQKLFQENIPGDELRLGQRLNVLMQAFRPDQDQEVKAVILPWLHDLKLSSIQN